jgi:hypothetical protein
MMMECPRCGFSQPKDRYCAQCGVDVEQFSARPKPLAIRLLQNPNFHLSLIALSIVLVVGYILYSRSQAQKEASQTSAAFTSPPPGSSSSPPAEREAGGAPPPPTAPPQETSAARTAKNNAGAAGGNFVGSLAPSSTAPLPPQAGKATNVQAKSTAPIPRRLDISFWEIPREVLANLLVNAENAGESNEGRAYTFKDGARIAEAVQKNSRRLTLNRMAGLKAGSQVMIVTPANTNDPFQFGLMMQVARPLAEQSFSIHWESQLVLPQPESPQEVANQVPSVKQVVETNMTGTATLTPQNLLMLVVEPGNRRPRFEYLAKAGDGPWNIFSSDDFRTGITDWVFLAQLK